MLTLSETPVGLLQAISHAIAELHEPRARHWFVFAAPGRAEFVLQHWARLKGIASHTQEVQLRELLNQAGAGVGIRFDFEKLRLAIASALPDLHDKASPHPLPLPPSIPTTPLTSAVLDWATALAKALDDALLSRNSEERWPKESFLQRIFSHPLVAASLERHLGLATPTEFECATLQWMESWEARGGLPHLWIQLDAGVPAIQFERLLQLVELVRRHHPDRIHLFALSPSSEYWGEARLRSKPGTQVSTDPELNPGGLLWALGRFSQDLHRQLCSTYLAEGDGGTFVESPPCPNSLLGRLQLSCRFSAPLNTAELQPLAPNDSSLTVHSARTTLRELEICRDRILQARLELPDLRYEEILILLADPARQAPFIEAALRSPEPDARSLPYRLIGLGQSVPSPLAEGLLTLLDTLRGRLGLEDVQALIESPLISKQFEFHLSQSDGADLVSWLSDAQFRWGLDTAHRADFQPIQPDPEHRWNLSWALQRLGLGAIVAPQDRDAILPLPHQPHHTLALERSTGLGLSSLAQLAKFSSALKEAREIWFGNTAKPLQDWNSALLALVQTFLDCNDASSAAHLATLQNSILPSLKRAAGSLDLCFTAEAYISLIKEKLASIADSSSRGTGGICVAGLRHYAGIPARLIIVAGLDDSKFPQRDDRPQWHPLSKSRHSGDPSLRDSDRHALLLAILACGERLVLSYQGGTDTDSKERPPSTALADVIHAVEQAATHSQATDDAQSQAHDRGHSFLFQHSLSGVSPTAFAAGLRGDQQNFLATEFEAAQVLSSRRGLPEFPGLWSSKAACIEQASQDTITLEDLRLLFHEPCKIFLSHNGIRLPKQSKELSSGDLIETGGLQKWMLRDQLLQAHLEGSSAESIIKQFEVAGTIPRGVLGLSLCEKILAELPDPPHPFFNSSQRYQHSYEIPLEVTGATGQRPRITGMPKAGWYLSKGSKTAYFYSASTEAPRHLIAFCIEALCFSAQALADPSHPEVTAAEAFFKNGKKATFQIPPPSQAVSLLHQLSPLVFLARSFPLPFWSGSMEAVAKAVGGSTQPDTEIIHRALDAGYQFWTTGPGTSRVETPPESLEPATRYSFRGCQNPFLLTPNLPQATWLPASGFPLSWRLLCFLESWLNAAGFPIRD